MLSGKAPFQSSSHRDCSAAAIMERIRGGEFNTKGKEFELVSEQAKKLIEGKGCFNIRANIFGNIQVYYESYHDNPMSTLCQTFDNATFT